MSVNQGRLALPPRIRKWSQRARLLTLALLCAALGAAVAVPRLTPAAGQDVAPLKTFTLTAQEVDWELQPGTTVKAWTYNGVMPGPEIRVQQGDRVRITLRNQLPEGTTIHWHGLNVPNDMDGPAGLNQAPVEPGQAFTYEFSADQVGTRWYHSHTDVVTQVALGLYGSLIVEPRQQKRHYDRDFTFVLSEWDTELTPAVATGAAPRGPRDSDLRGGEIGADLYLLNGMVGGAIDPLIVTKGDRVLIRLINAGNIAHPFHIHGHTFKIVATDGNAVPKAAQLSKDTVLIAPGERYDLELNADNPGVWMIHCHIENHAENGMMTYLQYEGYLPTGPVKDVWQDSSGGMGDMPGMAGTEMGHSATSPAAAIPVTAPPEVTHAGPAPTDENQIVMLDDRFQGKSVTVPVGAKVTWVNRGHNSHSVASIDGDFVSGQIIAGQTFSYTFTKPGTYKYVCKYHALHGMTGVIVVQ